MKLHHIGILVYDLPQGAALIQRFFHAAPAGSPVDDPLQQATVQMFEASGATIELIAPLGPTSHLHNALSRQGEGLAHLCFETSNLDLEIDSMRKSGALLISRKPAVAFGGRDVAFLFLPNKMIVELLQA